MGCVVNQMEVLFVVLSLLGLLMRECSLSRAALD